jgi:hypothetical protein
MQLSTGAGPDSGIHDRVLHLLVAFCAVHHIPSAAQRQRRLPAGLLRSWAEAQGALGHRSGGAHTDSVGMAVDSGNSGFIQAQDAISGTVSSHAVRGMVLYTYMFV